jgi:glycosyltransferase involved in cell wall biosynthesis
MLQRSNFIFLLYGRNAHHNVEFCLKSCLGQIYPHFKIFVTDCGSTDTTNEAIRLLTEGNPNVLVWKTEVQTGLYTYLYEILPEIHDDYVIVIGNFQDYFDYSCLSFLDSLAYSKEVDFTYGTYYNKKTGKTSSNPKMFLNKQLIYPVLPLSFKVSVFKKIPKEDLSIFGNLIIEDQLITLFYALLKYAENSKFIEDTLYYMYRDFGKISNVVLKKLRT